MKKCEKMWLLHINNIFSLENRRKHYSNLKINIATIVLEKKNNNLTITQNYRKIPKM